MKSKPNKPATIKKRMTIAFAIITILTLAIVSLVTYVSVNSVFNEFLNRQGSEGLGYARGRASEVEDRRSQRFEELVNQFEGSMLGSILFASLVGFSLSIAAGTFVSGKITFPLSDLRSKINALTNNQRQKVVSDYSVFEIKSLADDFNSLIDELNRLDEAREMLVSNVAHELKTPITRIRGQLEGIIDGVYSPTPDQLNRMLDSINQLQQLIDSLQKIVMAESYGSQVNKQDIYLHQLVTDLFAGVSKSDIKFINQVPKDATVYADRRMLIEVLDNLITNSVRYTSKGSISLQFEDGIIRVKDTGIGIGQNDLPYIFERLYRADKSRSKDTGGFGLGLSIVKEIVVAHNWEINVQSEVGKGTTFEIVTKS